MNKEEQVALAEQVVRDAADRGLYLALRAVHAKQEAQEAKEACGVALRDLEKAQRLRDAMRADLEAQRLAEAAETPPAQPEEPSSTHAQSMGDL